VGGFSCPSLNIVTIILSKNCLGNIQGAKYLLVPKAILERQLFISPWIVALIDARDRIEMQKK
jgi:hypothetical protein